MSAIELKSNKAHNIIKSTIIQPEKCSICAEICSNPSKLVRHMAIVHQINTNPSRLPFQCSTCHLALRNQYALTAHENVHLRRQPSFQCKECPKAFINQSALKLHERIHKDHKPYACHICPYKSNQVSNLKTHMLKHEVAQFKCDDCNQVFKHKRTLIKHVSNEHLGKKEMFPCLFCNKRYASREALNLHIKTHTGENVGEECPVCHKNYRRLHDHMVMHKEKAFECDICRKSFKRAPELKVHMRVHTGEKPYECKLCGNKFRQHAHYMSHLKTHTSEKGHECSICKKRFAGRQHLKNHMQQHEGTLELKYSCTVCPKKFLSSYHLRIHAAIHVPQEERERFECKECGVKLSSKPNLTTHMGKHSGIRFQCNICNSEFYRIDMYKDHLRKHGNQGAAVFHCKHCGIEFESVQSYRKHVACCGA